MDVMEYLDNFTHEFTNIILDKMKNEDIFKTGEEFEQSALFDFEKDSYELPLKDFTEDEINRADPDHRIIKNKNSDLYLSIKNECGFSYLGCLIRDNNISAPRYYNLRYSESVSITENADFIVEGYNKKEKYGHLCGFSKTQESAHEIATFAAAVNFSKMSETDRIIVTDYNTEKPIMSFDSKGEYLLNEKKSAEKGLIHE